jgi:hypothetical protein
MVEGIVFIIKGLILTEVFSNAARVWGIFESPRTFLSSRSSFLRELLACFDCTSIWAAFFSTCYLLYFEWPLFTYALLFHWFARISHNFYDLLDAHRAIKEKQL